MLTNVTYLGGPTALIEYAGLRILTDPTFDPPGSYDSDGDALVKTVGPAIAADALGTVDLVLLSHHEHEDNLDTAGAAYLGGVPLVLSTVKASDDLGLPVTGLENWQRHRVNRVTVTAVPALHGPPGIGELIGPVTGFVLEADGEPTVYVSGDNASLSLVEHIAERFPGIDIAVLFAGAARVPSLDGALTLTSTDAVVAARLLGATRVIGLHTEDWEHFSETRAQLEAAFAGTGLLVDTPRGVTVALQS